MSKTNYSEASAGDSISSYKFDALVHAAVEVLYTFSILVNILLDAALTGSIAYRTAAA